MPNGALDNDVLLKGACYLMLLELVAATNSAIQECGVLGAARFVVLRGLELRGLNEASVHFSGVVDQFALLEPTEAEAATAADIELEAQRQGLALDVGESLLSAIVETRNLTFLATGDKRAISALEQVSAGRVSEGWWSGRVVCLEQLIRRVMTVLDGTVVRDRVCAAPKADRSLSICFSCVTGAGDASAWIAALDSYIASLRTVAPRVLAAA